MKTFYRFAGRFSAVILAVSVPMMGLCQSPEQFSNNATDFVERGKTPVVVVRQSATKKEWVKLFARITKATWDVKKTDSLLQPIIAVVKVDLQTGVSERFATKELAEQTELVQNDFNTETIDLQFVPTATGWAFSKGQKFSVPLRQMLAVKAPPLSTTFTGYGWLIQGFSVVAP